MSSNTTVAMVNSSSFVTPSIPQYEVKSRIKNAGSKVLNVVREGWAGLEKAFGIAKNSINTRLQLRSSYPLKDSQAHAMKTSIHGMKLFAVLNLPLNAMHLPGTAKEIIESIKLKDTEGAVLSAMTFTILTADMFDSFTDVVNASLFLSGKAALGGVFAVVGLPVVMGMIGLSAISKGVQLWNLSKFDSEIKKLMSEKVKEESPQETRGALLDFVNDKLGRLGRKTKRDTNEKTVKILEGLKKKLEANETLQQKEVAEIGKTLKKIRSSLDETKKVAKWSLVAFSIMLVAFTLFFTTVPMAIPFVMLAVGFAIRFSVWAHQKQLFRRKPDALETID